MEHADPWQELISEKRGGKRRKAPKRKRRARKQANVGDTVYLIPGRAPMPPMYHHHQRLATPGQLYSELPKVLRQQSYAAAPAAYRPMTQHEFVAAGDKMYGRGRNFYDDIMINVNPSNIQPNRKPSKRIVPSYNKNTAPTVNQPILSSLPFQGDTPIIHLTADRTPSMRAVSSQPTTGYINTRMPAPIAGVHYAVSAAAAAEQFGSQEEQQEALQSVASARAPKRITQAEYEKRDPEPWNTWAGWRYYLDDARKRFPTLKDVKEETGYRSYKALIEGLRDQYPDEESVREAGDERDTLDSLVYTQLTTMKRGGVRRRGRGGY